MNRLHFTLTPEQLLQAARAHNRSKWPQFVCVYVLCAALVAIILETLFGIVDAWFILEMVGVALSVAIVLFALAQLWLIPRKLRKALVFLDPESLEYHVEWDDTHFGVKTGDGHSSIKIAKLAGWRQIRDLLLIFRLPEHYYVIPNAAFENAAQRQQLIERLRADGVKESK